VVNINSSTATNFSIKYIKKGGHTRGMEVVIAKDTSVKIKEVSEALGIEKEEVVDRAILLYLDNIDKYLDLKKEMKEWDALSDEALHDFEKLL